MEKYTIYMHRNLINNKVYIGQTRDELNRRFKKGYGYRSSPHFYASIQKYGWDNFEHIVLEENLSAETANEREKFWIALFKSNEEKFGYNLTPGGCGQPAKKTNQTLRKKVYCKETGQCFNSITEAALWAGLKKTGGSNITSAIKGLRKTAGNHPETGEPLHWCFLEEELNLPNEKPKKGNAKRVKNLDTNEIFDSVNEAARVYQMSNVSISKSCKSNGTIPTGPNGSKIKYHWVFW